eukprot:361077_1
MARTAMVTLCLLVTLYNGEIIDCTEEEFKEQDIICSQLNEPCTINCLDDYSCFAAKIQCNADTACNVNCNNEYSCLKTKIQCPLNSDCSVNGLSLNSLSESIIQCPITHATDCTVHCNASLSCHNTLIDGQHTDTLSLYCDQTNSCLDFTVKCPEYNLTNNQPNCIISGEDQSDHTNVEFFAINGFKDIDTTQYISNIGTESVLFCGTNHTQSCVINADTFNCVNTTSPCYVSTPFPTISPTEIPTPLPTIVPTPLATMYPTMLPTMYPTTQPSLTTQIQIITTKIMESTRNVGGEIITSFHEEHAAEYVAPKLVFDGHDAVYLVAFATFIFISLLVITCCIYVNCTCPSYKEKLKQNKKRRYGQVIELDIPPLQ